MFVAVDDVLTFTSDGPGTPDRDQAQQALDVAAAMVDGYCRGRARMSDGDWRPGAGEVVLSVAARILANPSGIQYRDQAGPFSISRQSGFTGFTLAEQYVLNRYRKAAI